MTDTTNPALVELLPRLEALAEQIERHVAECDTNGFIGFFNQSIYVDEAKALLSILAALRKPPADDGLVERINRAIERETLNLPMKASTATINVLEDARAALSQVSDDTVGRIVAWLRDRSNHRHPDWAFANVFADAIERGEPFKGDGQAEREAIAADTPPEAR